MATARPIPILESGGPHCFGELIGRSPAMAEVFSWIERVAPSDVGVLLLGESGTGKELVAREIHRRSLRSKGSLVCLNCAAIPETLVESELFGYQKGAFTGASETRAGKFERAHGGTLFLDEVGDLSPEAQAKVLRVLEDGGFERLGGGGPGRADVRLIAATNQDLEERVAKGCFREDLLYRLDVVRIELPPLRQRGEDIPLLIDYFLKSLARKQFRPVPAISPEAALQLRSYPYPGNVRQLRHIVERMLLLADARAGIQLSDLPENVRNWNDAAGQKPAQGEWQSLLEMDYKAARENFEIWYLTSHLRRQAGNISRTARVIGLHRQSLQQKVRRLSLKPGRS